MKNLRRCTAAWLLLAPLVAWAQLDGLGQVNTTSITNNSVTFAKMQDIPSHTVIGNNTGVTGDPQAVTATQALDWLGAAAQGSLLYRNASNWVPLAPGVAGQVLTAGLTPSWTTPAGQPAGGNYVQTGCGVAWNGGLSYTVSQCTYVIQNVTYNVGQTNITLAASDPTLDRFDAFVVDTSSVASAITGTPASSPESPDIDPETQLQISTALVTAGSVAGSGSVVDIYRENTEWTYSDNTANLNPDSVTNPHAGTKDIEGTSVVGGNQFTLASGAPLDPSAYNAVVLWIAPKAAWASTKSLRVYWMNGTAQVGVQVPIQDGGPYGFNSSSTSYQAIVVSTNLFGTNGALADRLRVKAVGTGAAIGFYVDDIYLQAGVVPPSAPNARMFYRGDYSAVTAYTPQDVVRYQGRLYTAVIANVGSTPSATDANANWKIIAVRTVESADITDGTVANADLANMAGTTIKGRSAGTAGVPVDIACSTTDGVLRESGGTLACGTVATGGITNDAITYAKIQNITAASRLLGRGSAGGAGDTEELTVVAPLSISGTTLTVSAGSGLGDVTGPGSATDNAITRFDGTTGKLIQNSGITIADGASGALSGTNTGDQNLFSTFAVSGQSDVVADSTTDTLTLAAGSNITLTTNAGTDTVTITAAGSSGAAVADIQNFSASGTWTKPSGSPQQTHVVCIGGGGGGSSGSINFTASSEGGAGGGGAAMISAWFSTSVLNATETVTIGAGGAGGAGTTSGGATAAIGTAGGTTTFGTWLKAFGGGGGGSNASANVSTSGGGGGGLGGVGGTPTGTTGGTAGDFGGVAGGGSACVSGADNTNAFGGASGSCDGVTTSTAGNGGRAMYGGNGGGGGGSATSSGDAAGGAGPIFGSTSVVAGGTSGGGNGAAATGIAETLRGAGGGGGGSKRNLATSAIAGNGGNGQQPGGGGGGGGAAFYQFTGGTSGNGGNGGNGYCRATTYF